jgi:phage I-like protein
MPEIPARASSLQRPARLSRAGSLIAVCVAQLPAVAACVFEIPVSDSSWIQVLPAGTFRARDGRPEKLDGWHIDATIAANVIAKFAARRADVAIDYEHQTLNAETNGLPAPAAGYIVELKWREGEGLFARVEWTERAKANIAAREYRYFSPVFAFNKTTGDVEQLLLGALTNDPALDDLQEVTLRAAARFQNRPEEPVAMNKLLIACIAALTLAADATEDQAIVALNALKKKADDADSEIAALKEKVVDPAKFVPVATFDQLKSDFAALTTKLQKSEVDALVEDGLATGKLLKPQEDWARALGASDLAALKAYLDKTPEIPALRGSQTGGKAPPAADPNAELTADELAVCKRLGIEPEQFKKQKAAA